MTLERTPHIEDEIRAGAEGIKVSGELLDRSWDSISGLIALDDELSVEPQTRKRREGTLSRRLSPLIAFTAMFLVCSMAVAATPAGQSLYGSVLDVIAGTTSSDDKAPAEVDAVFRDMTADDPELPAWAQELLPGATRGQRKKLLTSKASGTPIAIWAVVTDRNQLCWQVTRGGSVNQPPNSDGGVCFDEFPPNWPASSLEVRSDTDRIVRVYGVAADGVTVAVETSRGRQDLEMQNQAYFWEAPSPNASPEAIVLTNSAGREFHRAIDFDD
jgi:hypothetical protein